MARNGAWTAAALLLVAAGCREGEVAPGELPPLPPDPVVQVLDFQAAAGQEAIQSFSVRNPGGGPVFLHAALADAPFSTDLERLERLGPGEERRITFRFRPLEPGSFEDEVVVRDSGGGAAIVVLEGTATGAPSCVEEAEDVHAGVRQSIDVLVLVDDGAATEAVRDRLVANVAALPAIFEEAQVDYRIAVVAGSTHSTCKGGSLLGDPAVLEPTLDDVASRLESRLQIAACAGKGDGFVSVVQALDSDAGRAFLRPASRLLLIFVSARDDGSPESPATYLRTFLGHKGDGEAALVSAFSVVGHPSAGCEGALPAPRYGQAATLLGGTIVDVCKDDWELGARWRELPVAGVPSVYALTREPTDVDGDVRITEADLEVRVDGAVVPPRDPEANRVWDWQPDTRTIEFYSAFVPAPEAEVRIRYALACDED